MEVNCNLLQTDITELRDLIKKIEGMPKDPESRNKVKAVRTEVPIFRRRQPNNLSVIG